MNEIEFDKCMGLLKSSYGEAKYPPVRCEEIFKRVKPLEVDDFNSIVRNLIACEDRAPMMAAIVQASSQKLQDACDRRYKGTSSCVVCEGEGYFLRKQFKNGHRIADVVYRCRCDAGTQWQAYNFQP